MKGAVLLAVLTFFVAGQAAADTRSGREAFLGADFATALKELQPEADKGDPEAQLYLGKMYQAGLGVKKDLATAIKMFAQAAEAGNSDAQVIYGLALALGEGAEANIVEGLKWMYVSGLGGNKEAREKIDQISRGMPRDVLSQARKLAFEWNAAHAKKDSKEDANAPVPAGAKPVPAPAAETAPP